MDKAAAGGRSGFLASIPWKVKRLIYLVFFTAVGYGYLQILITAHLPEVGYDSTAVSWILGANGAAMVAGSIPIGLYADRTEKKRVLIAGLVGFPVALLVFALTTNFSALLAAGAVAGLAEGAYLTTWNALVADMTTPENRDKAFALTFIVGMAAIGLGYALPFALPFVGGWFAISAAATHGYATAALALFAAVSPLGMVRLLRDHHEARSEIHRRPSQSYGLLWRFSGLNSVMGMGAGFFIPLVPTWLYFRFAVPDTLSGPLLAAASITVAAAALASPAISKKVGIVKAIAFTQGSSAAFMLGMAFAPAAVSASGLYMVRATLMNMSSPLSDSFLMGIIPAEQRSFASAINSVVWRLPNSITTIVGGAIMTAGNFLLPIYLATAFYLSSVAGFYAIFRKVKPSG